MGLRLPFRYRFHTRQKDHGEAPHKLLPQPAETQREQQSRACDTAC